jgi:hypothetical protein
MTEVRGFSSPPGAASAVCKHVHHRLLHLPTRPFRVCVGNVHPHSGGKVPHTMFLCATQFPDAIVDVEPEYDESIFLRYTPSYYFGLLVAETEGSSETVADALCDDLRAFAEPELQLSVRWYMTHVPGCTKQPISWGLVVFLTSKGVQNVKYKAMTRSS